MGYGHERAVYPLRHFGINPISPEKQIINANDYDGIPKLDKFNWEGGRKMYEFISKHKNVPIIGDSAFKVMDYMQRIEPFYPKRDLTKPTLQLKQIFGLLKKGFGRDLIEKLNKKPLPYITSFFTTAFFAEQHDFKEDIYCLCTDTDITRAWAPINAKKSRIKYFAPNYRVKERLMMYGVRENRIYVSGFPLPLDCIGEKEEILKQHLGCRLGNLDKKQKFVRKYQASLDAYLGKQYCNISDAHPLTIMFAVGGAGAQKETGIQILKSLKEDIKKEKIRLILVAGTKGEIHKYFEEEIKKEGMEKNLGKSIIVLCDFDKHNYFEKMNELLLTTDILWTKPSELSFYAGLGIPIIMTEPVGAQEKYNRDWLISMNAGIDMQNPLYTREWLMHLLNTGWLAESAFKGFLDAPRNGVKHIEDIVFRGIKSEIEDIHLL
jgi:hypothetical protein